MYIKLDTPSKEHQGALSLSHSLLFSVGDRAYLSSAEVLWKSVSSHQLPDSQYSHKNATFEY